MAKRNLSALLDTSITAAPPAEDTTSSPTTPVDQAASGDEAEAAPRSVPSVLAADTPPAKPPARPAKAIRAVQLRTRASAGPRYLELDRKELRIRGDQADDLTALTRQLNRARKGTGSGSPTTP